jgi:2-dehydro-3-deoxyphosphogluconate aldolase/(4S)-4-hydroxy-2-oxoglutarate aldolase
MTLIEEIEHHKLIVAVRTDTPEKAYKAAIACITGGIHMVEITFSVPGADEIIRTLRMETKALIGAGTVLSISDLTKALKAGASYIVSPHVDEEIVKCTKKEGAISIPGACTPTEIYRAYQAGGDIIKLFPFVEIGGLHFLKAILKFMLSGGVTLDNIAEYLSVKASCILIGSSILKKEFLAVEDWDSITGLSREFMQKIGRSSLPDRKPT